MSDIPSHPEPPASNPTPSANAEEKARRLIERLSGSAAIPAVELESKSDTLRRSVSTTCHGLTRVIAGLQSILAFLDSNVGDTVDAAGLYELMAPLKSQLEQHVDGLQMQLWYSLPQT